MKRRKFLAGLGAVGAGSATAIGTGAFTQMSADRGTILNITSDDQAYLSLAPAESHNGDQYVMRVGDQDQRIALAFNKWASDHGGKGVNTDAFYQFRDTVRVCNRSSRAKVFWGVFADDGTFGNNRADVWLYPGRRASKKLNGEDNVLRLESGECESVGVAIKTYEKDRHYGGGGGDNDNLEIHAQLNRDRANTIEAGDGPNDGADV